jgi:uncharacterized membrane protein YhaH (DUF805 family)
MNDIEKKLNTISTLFFVLAVVGIPASFIAPAVIFHSMSSAAPQARAILMFIAGFCLICSFVLTVCIALVGHAIRKRRWWTFCFVASILMCPSFPLGTALGIFSLITLNKAETKKMFSPNQSAHTTA